MARIRGSNTGLERALASALRSQGLRPARNVRGLPGTPDFVFHRLKVAVFVDGDFWHGWKFQLWRLKLTPAWEEKIARNIARDGAAHRALRRAGWTVLRIWEHEMKSDIDRCTLRVVSAYQAARARNLD